MKRLCRAIFPVLLCALAFGAGEVLAQSYPKKPVRIVVNMAPGGVVDLVARSIGQKLTEAWNQPVLIENRGGSGGNIGADVVAKAAPDGHTLLMTTSGLAISPSLYRRLPFDALKDFAPISQVCSTFLVLTVNSKVRATSSRELIALAKSKPGSLNYGHTGVGSTLQLTMELLKASSGADLLAVPYKGTALISTALVTGEVDAAFMPPETVLSHIKAGKLRALAITNPARSPLLPEVPTMAEAGAQDFGLPGWYGLFAPAGTAREIVESIQRDAVRALNLPEVRDRIVAMGPVPVGSTVREFEAKYKEDLARFAKIVADTRIPPQD
ncbi:MAG: tripartite tricarboxylate transporter substrate binding protein [Betaproteobacteria bacterium]|nr:tripartite tricarboxylate transporter substrate binding protein [Betaproteobacteria bacterium]